MFARFSLFLDNSQLLSVTSENIVVSSPKDHAEAASSGDTKLSSYDVSSHQETLVTLYLLDTWPQSYLGLETLVTLDLLDIWEQSYIDYAGGTMLQCLQDPNNQDLQQNAGREN